MKLFYVTAKIPPRKGQRKTRVWRFVALAPDADSAVERVRANSVVEVGEESVDWHATLDDEGVVSIGVYFE